MEWYCKVNDKETGPLDFHDLERMLQSGEVKADTLIKTNSASEWVKLIESGLVELDTGAEKIVPPPLPGGKSIVTDVSAVLENAERIAVNILDAAPQHAIATFRDLKEMDWKAEILPIDSSNLNDLMKSGVFWSSVLLGVTPLFIVTLQEADAQLTVFALFFAALWGVLFHKFIMKADSGLKWTAGALFFTGVIGINLLLLAYTFIIPDFFLNLVNSDIATVRLFGFVFQVGICEELCKLLPVLIYAVFKFRSVNPVTMIEVGVFSGLGFAAFENVSYGHDFVLNTYVQTMQYGEAGLAAGVHTAMVATMLRSLSLVFCHAVWSGIFAYFVSTVAVTRRRIIVLFFLGLAVSSVLHGIYNWFVGVQPTVAALLAGFSFALFYGYLSKVSRSGVEGTAPAKDESRPEVPADAATEPAAV